MKFNATSSHLALASTACWAMLATVQVLAGEVTPALQRSMAHKGTHADTAVIVRFTNPVDVQALTTGERLDRSEPLLLALKERAARHRAAITPTLQAQGAVKVRDLWLINAVALTVPAVAVKALAALDGVATVDLDAFVQGGRSQRTPAPRNAPGEVRVAVVPPVASKDIPTPDFKQAKPGWNLASIHVPELWAMGHTGKGVVVATMDTGVDDEHPDLRGKWRGGANSWFDPHGEEPYPYDALGHGTQSLGVVLGNPDIGVAPQARWIGVRLFDNNGRASMSDIHRAFQWLLDPDGDPSTMDAPVVVNASWALTGRGSGSCILEFDDDVRILKRAGIVVVFAAGNDGPLPKTSNSPGNNPGVMSVGAVDRDMEIARQTSRGPSSCDGKIFPKLLAPGVNIRTSDLSYGGVASYTNVSGSSLAAPHVTGVLALLSGAFPRASVAQLENALTQSAVIVGDGPLVHLDALAAFNLLRDKQELVKNGPAPLAVAQ
ncbi:MAG TPA: S8 family serine peptidase [Burkholderiaceae bacterium]|nr:S8 family serine peptidase [Burkholderiaceae bacterium]HPH12825.1 S8 family serine peptidase [Burkholderiaceae bacterium]